MNLTEKQIALIKKANSVTELSELAKESGFDFSSKEIEEIYNLYHYPNKKMADAELTNIVAGAYVYGGSCYSNDICFDDSGIKRKYLIVSAINSCVFGSEKGGKKSLCANCEFSRRGGIHGFTIYCTLRWWEGDGYYGGHESNPDNRR